LSLIDLSNGSSVVRLDTSICIIGSGPGGAFAAVELAADGHDVLVVETGTSIADMDPGGFVDSVSVEGGATLRFGFSRQLGGSSNLWSGRVAPFEFVDFEKRDWIDESGWPIGLQDLYPYYVRAAGLMRLPYPNFLHSHQQSVSSELASLLPQSPDDLLDVKRFFWVEPPFNTGDHLKSAMRASDGRLRILTSAHVRRLVQNPAGNLVSHAVVATPDGHELKIMARYFVLAAGGIEATRILLNSTSTSSKGLGNEDDLVGRYFTTHPKADLGVLVLNERVPISYPLFVDCTVDGGRIRHGLGFSARMQAEHHGLNHYVQISPMLEYRLSSFFEAVKGSSALNSPFIDRSRFIRSFLPGLGLMAFEAIGRLAGLQRRARLFMLRAFLDQHPNRSNRILLSSACDRFGDRKVDIKWSFSDQDRQSVLLFFSCLDQEFRKRGLGHIESTLSEMHDWPLVGVHSHFMGTTRMGNNPKHAVVDKDCRVFSTENLFISGPSTFPTGGYANPFFTIAALSLRLADHLKRCLQPSSLVVET